MVNVHGPEMCTHHIGSLKSATETKHIYGNFAVFSPERCPLFLRPKSKTVAAAKIIYVRAAAIRVVTKYSIKYWGKTMGKINKMNVTTVEASLLSFSPNLRPKIYGVWHLLSGLWTYGEYPLPLFPRGGNSYMAKFLLCDLGVRRLTRESRGAMMVVYVVSNEFPRSSS